jgi:hypothetical protein
MIRTGFNWLDIEFKGGGRESSKESTMIFDGISGSKKEIIPQLIG